jgi:hypothetical protein
VLSKKRSLRSEVRIGFQDPNTFDPDGTAATAGVHREGACGTASGMSFDFADRPVSFWKYLTCIAAASKICACGATCSSNYGSNAWGSMLLACQPVVGAMSSRARPLVWSTIYQSCPGVPTTGTTLVLDRCALLQSA